MIQIVRYKKNYSFINIKDDIMFFLNNNLFLKKNYRLKKDNLIKLQNRFYFGYAYESRKDFYEFKIDRKMNLYYLLSKKLREDNTINLNYYLFEDLLDRLEKIRFNEYLPDTEKVNEDFVFFKIEGNSSVDYDPYFHINSDELIKNEFDYVFYKISKGKTLDIFIKENKYLCYFCICFTLYILDNTAYLNYLKKYSLKYLTKYKVFFEKFENIKYYIQQEKEYQLSHLNFVEMYYQDIRDLLFKIKNLKDGEKEYYNKYIIHDNGLSKFTNWGEIIKKVYKIENKYKKKKKEQEYIFEKKVEIELIVGEGYADFVFYEFFNKIDDYHEYYDYFYGESYLFFIEMLRDYFNCITEEDKESLLKKLVINEFEKVREFFIDMSLDTKAKYETKECDEIVNLKQKQQKRIQEEEQIKKAEDVKEIIQEELKGIYKAFINDLQINLKKGTLKIKEKKQNYSEEEHEEEQEEEKDSYFNTSTHRLLVKEHKEHVLNQMDKLKNEKIYYRIFRQMDEEFYNKLDTSVKNELFELMKQSIEAEDIYELEKIEDDIKIYARREQILSRVVDQQYKLDPIVDNNLENDRNEYFQIATTLFSLLLIVNSKNIDYILSVLIEQKNNNNNFKYHSHIINSNIYTLQVEPIINKKKRIVKKLKNKNILHN